MTLQPLSLTGFLCRAGGNSVGGREVGSTLESLSGKESSSGKESLSGKEHQQRKRRDHCDESADVQRFKALPCHSHRRLLESIEEVRCGGSFDRAQRSLHSGSAVLRGAITQSEFSASDCI